MIYILLLFLLLFHAEAYEAYFFINSSDNVSATVYSSTNNEISYNIKIDSSDITSQSDIFYVPMIVTDANNKTVNSNFIKVSINNEELSLTKTSNGGRKIINVPITLQIIRTLHTSGSSVTIPITMSVKNNKNSGASQNKIDELKFNLLIQAIGTINVSQDKINWIFKGNWDDCKSTVSLTYQGIIQNMRLSIVSDHCFNLVSNKNNKISYSISYPNMIGNKNDGYEAKITDNETMDLNIAIDTSNSICAEPGNYTDTITITQIPDV